MLTKDIQQHYVLQACALEPGGKETMEGTVDGILAMCVLNECVGLAITLQFSIKRPGLYQEMPQR